MTTVGRSRLAAAVVVVLAYLPPLFSGARTMNADTKLGLTLNPGRLLSDATLTWDGHQFAGWVPHQTIAYLWPSGPFYWLADRLGLPDWATQRLWVSTLLCAAGLGVFWLVRRLGVGVAAGFAAAVVYMLSPYVLAYMSRTSVMLLPWAGLPWIVGFTAHAARQRGWRWPAAVALMVATVGAVNATALAMIIPGPVLWLVCAATTGQISWRRAGGAAVRIGLLCAAVSMWWAAMVSTQSKFGADVLSYSETLDAVSLTSSSTETMRGLGYWLFYVRDPYAMTTSAARPYMMSGRLIATGFVLLVAALIGLAISRWAYRRFAALLIVTGVIIGVGVHPVGDAPPLTSLLSGSWLSLAVRSSTRAVPLMLLGVALGIAMLVQRAAALPWAAAAHRPQWARGITAAAVAALAVINLPALYDGGIVDPALAHGDPPEAWHQAVAELGSSDGRVLQLPGSEFGAFDWGYTVDQPLLDLTEKPLVTRDLLPLGSAAAMDLLYAFDNRIQDGTLDARSVATVARLLGADRIWVANDIDSDRFRTPRPGMTEAMLTGAPGITKVGTYGETSTAPTRFVDERDLLQNADTIPRVELYSVDSASVVRAGTRTVVVAGSGDGIVDAAAAGLLDGSEALLYSAALPTSMPTTPAAVILTDSNRARAEQWRSSQDTLGFTEGGGADGGVTVDDPADARLPVFTDLNPADQTTAALDGSLTVRASAYGEPFAYRPENRPAMAVDGDPTTAWVVGDRADPVGQSLTLSETGGPLRLLQPQGSTANRMITELKISWDGGSQLVQLGPQSLELPGQEVDVPGGAVKLTITKVGPRNGTDTGPSAVGFAEVLPTAAHEVVNLPRFPSGIDPTTPTSVVLTRLRHDAVDRWRTDPEPTLNRRIELPTTAPVTTSVTIRLNQRAEDATVASIIGGPPAVAAERMSGPTSVRGAAAIDGDPTTAWIMPFGSATGIPLTINTESTPVSSFTLVQPVSDLYSPITVLTIQSGATRTTVAVPRADASGRSLVTLPTPLAGSSMIISVGSTNAQWRGERRYGEVIQLPAAIAEIEGLPLAPADRATVRGCRTDLVSVNGQPVGIEITDQIAERLGRGQAVTVTPCSGDVSQLPAGRSTVISAAGTTTGIDIDQVVFAASADPATGAAQATPSVTMSGSGASRRLTVDACPTGCWVVFGEGFASAWEATARASTGSVSMGKPTLIDGGFNGWWLPATNQVTTIDLRWPAQRPVDLAIALSAATAIACLIVLIVKRRDAVPDLSAAVGPAALDRRLSRRRVAAAAAVLLAFSALSISWSAVIWCLPIVAALAVTRRIWPLWWLTAALVVVQASRLIWARRAGAWEPDAAWPVSAEFLHRPGLMVIAVLLAAALFDNSEHTVR